MNKFVHGVLVAISLWVFCDHAVAGSELKHKDKASTKSEASESESIVSDKQIQEDEITKEERVRNLFKQRKEAGDELRIFIFKARKYEITREQCEVDCPEMIIFDPKNCIFLDSGIRYWEQISAFVNYVTATSEWSYPFDRYNRFEVPFQFLQSASCVMGRFEAVLPYKYLPNDPAEVRNLGETDLRELVERELLRSGEVNSVTQVKKNFISYAYGRNLGQLQDDIIYREEGSPFFWYQNPVEVVAFPGPKEGAPVFDTFRELGIGEKEREEYLAKLPLIIFKDATDTLLLKSNKYPKFPCVKLPEATLNVCFAKLLLAKFPAQKSMRTTKSWLF